MNARKHGIHSQRIRLFRQESLEFEERFLKWAGSQSLDPQSDMEEFFVFQFVSDSFEIERVRELRLERRKERIDKAEENELADVEETGEMLFFDPCGPAAISGTRTHDWRKVRTSWTGKNPDPDRPAALVTKLESTALGLYWLLDRWTELHERLDGGGFWSRGDRLRACRLMGRQMLDAMDDRCVADVLACSYVLRPIGKQFSEFESDMDEFTKDAFVKDLRARYKDLVGKDEPERARQILIELVDEHVALIGEMLAEHEQEDPEERARRTIKMLALDLSPVGDKILGYEAKLKNAFNRGFEGYQKYKATKKKREGGEWDGGGGGGGGIPAAGRSRVTLRAPRAGGGDAVVDDADVEACGGFLPERCMGEDGGESGVSSLETQMEMGDCGEQVESALAAVSPTEFESTCPTREEGNPQNEAKLDEHVRCTQTQENEHVVAEFGVDLGLDNGETKPNSGGGGDGVWGTMEAGNGPCIPRGEECGDPAETVTGRASATQFASTCPTREAGKPQNEAKLDEHVRCTQTQENEHVVAEFGVDLGLDNGDTKPNSEGDSGGVEGTVREPEVGSAAGVPVRVEKRSKKGEERRLRREMWRREMERRGAADRAKLARKSEPPGGENNGGRGPPS